MYYDLKASGKRIATLRKQKGLTQEQLAEKLNISTSNMSKIEIGYSGISIDLMIELAFFFEVTFEYILLGEEPEILFKKHEKEKQFKLQTTVLLDEVRKFETLLKTINTIDSDCQ